MTRGMEELDEWHFVPIFITKDSIFLRIYQLQPIYILCFTYNSMASGSDNPLSNTSFVIIFTNNCGFYMKNKIVNEEDLKRMREKDCKIRHIFAYFVLISHIPLLLLGNLPLSAPIFPTSVYYILDPYYMVLDWLLIDRKSPCIIILSVVNSHMLLSFIY